MKNLEKAINELLRELPYAGLKSVNISPETIKKAELVNPEPLTLDELRELDGEPLPCAISLLFKCNRKQYTQNSTINRGDIRIGRNWTSA